MVLAANKGISSSRVLEASCTTDQLEGGLQSREDIEDIHKLPQAERRSVFFDFAALG
jgi:hypothetical protein